jgi:hypothetical protein
VAIAKLEDRTNRLFGREADLARLCERARRTGLTAVVGPPQIGKSWLLTELARRLDRETKPRCLVGFTRSPKGRTHSKTLGISVSRGGLIAWRELRNRWFADSPLEERRFEPSVPS